MDWTQAIDRNRVPLLRIVAALFALIGLEDGASVARLPKPLYWTVIRILRPAEAAVRRLIVVVARDVVLAAAVPRPFPAGLARSGEYKPRISFRLFDPRKRFDAPRHRGPKVQPRIHVLDLTPDPRVPLFRPRPPAVIDPEPDDSVSAASLCRRLAAIRNALEDLPRQARRYARWKAKPVEQRRPRVMSAMRPGAPPGFRKEIPHQVDAILHECHWLALETAKPDSS